MTTYTLSQAIAHAAVYGLTDTLLMSDYEATNRLVTVHQNWTPDGAELAVFRLARGKFKGQRIGYATRPKTVI